MPSRVRVLFNIVLTAAYGEDGMLLLLLFVSCFVVSYCCGLLLVLVGWLLRWLWGRLVVELLLVLLVFVGVVVGVGCFVIVCLRAVIPAGVTMKCS